MPLEDNQGICVLTHTNIAMDEIKVKLGHKSDVLFQYPNHFGTIQSFIDRFLVIPEFSFLFKRKLKAIDNEYASKRLSDNFRRNSHRFDDKKWFFRKIEKDLPKTFPPGQKTKIKDGYILKYIAEMAFSYKEEELVFIHYQTKQKLTDVTSKAYQFFYDVRYSLLEEGILFYHDAYSLAFKHIKRNPDFKLALNKRFKYLFIDEMQDTDNKQNTLINEIFDREKTIIQKFGDPRQSIYNSPKEKCFWKYEENEVLSIDKSIRFGEKIANVLKTVCVEENLNLNHNANIESHDPIIIVYENPEQVLERYCEILSIAEIQGESLINKIQSDEKNLKIKAVGWVGKDIDTDGKKYTIQSYFKEYKKDIRNKEKTDYTSLKSFVRHLNTNKVKDYSDQIIKALVQVLYLCGVKRKFNDKDMYYNKYYLLKTMKNKSDDVYFELMRNISIWSKSLNSASEYNEETFKEVCSYIIGDFKEIFGFIIKKELEDFLSNEEFDEEQYSEKEIEANNTYHYPSESGVEIEVELGTVHSVKGETHAATLYLETCYQGKFDTQWIMEQMAGKAVTNNLNTYEIQALKVAYVGMSRPRYLLCVAIHRDHIEGHEEDLEPNGWIIDKTMIEEVS
jgi:hypothetical protein